MLVVVVIISILAGAAVVNLSGRKDGYEIKAAAHNVAAALDFAANLARRRQTTTRLTWTAGHRGFQVTAVDSRHGNDFRPAEGMAGQLKNLPESVQLVGVGSGSNISSTENLPEYLEFHRDGRGFSGWLLLQNCCGQKYRIELMSQTGQVHVRQIQENE